MKGFLSPVIYLSNNWISQIGFVLVTTATVFWLFLLPSGLATDNIHPYLGILFYLLLPGVFFAGLALIPLGIYLRKRREKSRGAYPEDFPPLDLKHIALRRTVPGQYQ